MKLHLLAEQMNNEPKALAMLAKLLVKTNYEIQVIVSDDDDDEYDSVTEKPKGIGTDGKVLYLFFNDTIDGNQVNDDGYVNLMETVDERATLVGYTYAINEEVWVVFIEDLKFYADKNANWFFMNDNQESFGNLNLLSKIFKPRA